MGRQRPWRGHGGPVAPMRPSPAVTRADDPNDPLANDSASRNPQPAARLRRAWAAGLRRPAAAEAGRERPAMAARCGRALGGARWAGALWDSRAYAICSCESASRSGRASWGARRSTTGISPRTASIASRTCSRSRSGLPCWGAAWSGPPTRPRRRAPMFSSDTVACSTMSALVMRLNSASYAARWPISDRSASVGWTGARPAAGALDSAPRVRPRPPAPCPSGPAAPPACCSHRHLR